MLPRSTRNKRSFLSSYTRKQQCESLGDWRMLAVTYLVDEWQ